MSDQIAILALAVLACKAVTIGGNGFIAAFAGGILLRPPPEGAPGRTGRVHRDPRGLAKGSFLVWSLFGALS